MRVICGLEWRRDFEEWIESDEESLVTDQKLSQYDAWVCPGVLVNYFELEDESKNAWKNDIEKFSL